MAPESLPRRDARRRVHWYRHALSGFGCLLSLQFCAVLGSELVIRKLDVEGGRLTFTEIPEALAYRVEWSTTMAPDSWSREAPGVSRIEPLGAGDRTVSVGIVQPPCFYRVVAEVGPLVPAGFVRIPGGVFQMGNPFADGFFGETPVHEVEVSAFFLQAKETTKAEWDAVWAWAVNNGYTFDNAGDGKGPDHPVHSVNWFDVVKWCNARSEKEGLVPCYYTDDAHAVTYRTARVNVTNSQVLWTADGYRLPTEAEWENAARGGLQGKRFLWGDTITHSQANYRSEALYAYDISETRGYHPSYSSGNTPHTSPVGSFAPNEYGVSDMAGNVWELCWDWKEDSYYSRSPATDPRGPTSGALRVYRGGSWSNGAMNARVATRGSHSSVDKYNNAGFRSVRGH